MEEKVKKPLKTEAILFAVFTAINSLILIGCVYQYQNFIFMSDADGFSLTMLYVLFAVIILFAVLTVFMLPCLIAAIILKSKGRESKFLHGISVAYAPVAALVIIPLFVLGIFKTASFSLIMTPEKQSDFIVSEIMNDESEFNIEYIEQKNPFGEEVYSDYFDCSDYSATYNDYGYRKFNSPIMKNKYVAFNHENRSDEEVIKGDGYVVYKYADESILLYFMIIEEDDEVYYASFEYDADIDYDGVADIDIKEKESSYSVDAFIENSLRVYEIAKNPELRPKNELSVFEEMLEYIENVG